MAASLFARYGILGSRCCRLCRCKVTLHQGELPIPREVEAQCAELDQILLTKWDQRLTRPSAGHTAAAAVRPVLRECLERKHEALTFRMTQVLSGHGKYLCRIGRELISRFHHCDNCPDDTELHTLVECPAWVNQ